MTACESAPQARPLRPAPERESREDRHSRTPRRMKVRREHVYSRAPCPRLLRRRARRQAPGELRPSGPRVAAIAAQPGGYALGPPQAPPPRSGPRPIVSSLRSPPATRNVPALAADGQAKPRLAPPCFGRAPRPSVAAYRPAAGPIPLRGYDRTHDCNSPCATAASSGSAQGTRSPLYAVTLQSSLLQQPSP